MGKLIVVVGGQYGSEGKGAVAGWLSAREEDLLAVRVAGPNAGHTVIAPSGTEWKFRHFPVAAVTNPRADLALAAGSEVDIDVLRSEAQELQEAGYDGIISVDPHATVIQETHKYRETGLVDQIGSTGKGIGAARADRAMRTALPYGGLGADTAHLIGNRLEDGGTVLIEGTQGFGLGLHGEHYPHCTSSDCRAIDFMSMAGVSPWDRDVTELEIWVVLRTFPIRVAGSSGPMKAETSWDVLETMTGGHVKPERTTVTNKIRRVGHWDPDLARQAMLANGWPSDNVHVALTFLDYFEPDLYKLTGPALRLTQEARDLVWNIESSINDIKIDLVGTGPAHLTEWRPRA